MNSKKADLRCKISRPNPSINFTFGRNSDPSPHERWFDYVICNMTPIKQSVLNDHNTSGHCGKHTSGTDHVACSHAHDGMLPPQKVAISATKA